MVRNTARNSSDDHDADCGVDVVIFLSPHATFQDLHDAIAREFFQKYRGLLDDADEANALLLTMIDCWRADLVERVFELLCDPEFAREAAHTEILVFFEDHNVHRPDIEASLPIRFTHAPAA